MTVEGNEVKHNLYWLKEGEWGEGMGQMIGSAHNTETQEFISLFWLYLMLVKALLISQKSNKINLLLNLCENLMSEQNTPQRFTLGAPIIIHGSLTW